MAKAKLVPTVPVPPSNIELTLSMEEARTLYAITRLVGGSPEGSRRGHTDSIGLALLKIGIRDNGIRINGTLDCRPDEVI